MSSTKSKALHDFFNTFGTAYPSTSVPETTQYPWITYENKIGNTGDVLSCAVTLWYHTSSEAVPNKKADDIADAIGLGGVLLHADDGVIWVRRGTPWCQSISDANDSTVKGRLLSVELEFI